jgi:hypothetical protein
VADCLDPGPLARPAIAALTGVLDSLLPPDLRRRSPRADD